MEYHGMLHIKCPYCGHINNVRSEIFENHVPSVITCDNEEGGCDSYFAVKVSLHPWVETFSMKEVETNHE